MTVQVSAQAMEFAGRAAEIEIVGTLPRVSTFTLWRVLHEAGYSHQQTRTWCPTGSALRRRKAGTVTVTDPDAGSKKS